MKYLQLLLPAIVLFSTSCGKAQYPKNRFTSMHTGHVLTSNCGGAVVQLTDGSPYGQNGWSNLPSFTGAPLNHVFKVANICTWGGAEANSDIRFRFIPMVQQNCVICKIFVLSPDTAYAIQVFK